MTKIVTATIEFEVDDEEYKQWGLNPEIPGVTVVTGEDDDWWYDANEDEGRLKIVSLEVKDKPRDWKFGDILTLEDFKALVDSGKDFAAVSNLGVFYHNEGPGSSTFESFGPYRLVYLDGVVNTEGEGK